jgi:Flp pilus assembly protein TadB
MDYQIVRAKNIAGKAMRKANKKKPGCPDVWKKKQHAMREYKKSLNAKKAAKRKMDPDYSKLIEWAILATIGLAVLSVSHPQVGILAIIFSILIVAAIMDTKIKNMNKKRDEEQKEHLEKMIRLVRNENRPQELAATPFKVIGEKTKTYVEETAELPMEKPATLTEFPYKKVHQ